jgi:hypothetical protein
MRLSGKEYQTGCASGYGKHIKVNELHNMKRKKSSENIRKNEANEF